LRTQKQLADETPKPKSLKTIYLQFNIYDISSDIMKSSQPKNLFICLIFFCFGWGNLFAIDTLDEAIERMSAYIIDRSPTGSVLAVVNIKSNNSSLSDYIMERIPDYVIRNNKKITFVDRSKLDLIQKEISFQYSGEVNDDTMVSIGNKIGAQIIVTGTISESGNTYNFNIKLLDVKTSVILGSSSTKVLHDNAMELYLPNSQVAQIARDQEKKQQQKKASTIKSVKSALGIFPKGFYLGYLGSLNSPLGISMGWINENVAFFMDNEFYPPSFNGYECSEDSYYTENTIFTGHTNSYIYEQQKTSFRWHGVLGLNINIIKTLLWLNMGLGIEYKQDYKLYSDEFSNENKIWIKNGGDTKKKEKYILSTGLYVKLWYFYIQGKYEYVIGDELDQRSYGLNHLGLGLGYVWKLD
jgi:TolB-like protein